VSGACSARRVPSFAKVSRRAPEVEARDTRWQDIDRPSAAMTQAPIMLELLLGDVCGGVPSGVAAYSEWVAAGRVAPLISTLFAFTNSRMP